MDITRKAQETSNRDVFAALPAGARFETVARFKYGYRTEEVYTKLAPVNGADRVQASDGRIWTLADCAAVSGAYILVPQGTYSATEYDVTWNRDRANPFRPRTGHNV